MDFVSAAVEASPRLRPARSPSPPPPASPSPSPPPSPSPSPPPTPTTPRVTNPVAPLTREGRRAKWEQLLAREPIPVPSASPPPDQVSPNLLSSTPTMVAASMFTGASAPRRHGTKQTRHTGTAGPKSPPIAIRARRGVRARPSSIASPAAAFAVPQHIRARASPRGRGGRHRRAASARAGAVEQAPRSSSSAVFGRHSRSLTTSMAAEPAPATTGAAWGTSRSVSAYALNRPAMSPYSHGHATRRRAPSVVRALSAALAAIDDGEEEDVDGPPASAVEQAALAEAVDEGELDEAEAESLLLSQSVANSSVLDGLHDMQALESSGIAASLVDDGSGSGEAGAGAGAGAGSGGGQGGSSTPTPTWVLETDAKEYWTTFAAMARSQFPDGLFKKLVDQPCDPGDARRIRKDVKRTYAGIDFEDQDDAEVVERLEHSLFRVLCAHAVWDGELGYCQGMNFLVGFFLTELDEEDTFWLLLHVLQTRHLRVLYQSDVPVLSLYIVMFNEYVSHHVPEVHKHLAETGYNPTFFTVEWFTTLFILNLRHDAARAVVTLLLSNRFDNALVRVGAALLHILQPRVLQLAIEGLMEVAQNFKTMARNVPVLQLIEVALSFPAQRDELERLTSGTEPVARPAFHSVVARTRYRPSPVRRPGTARRLLHRAQGSTATTTPSSRTGGDAAAAAVSTSYVSDNSSTYSEGTAVSAQFGAAPSSSIPSVSSISEYDSEDRFMDGTAAAGARAPPSHSKSDSFQAPTSLPYNPKHWVAFATDTQQRMKPKVEYIELARTPSSKDAKIRLDVERTHGTDASSTATSAPVPVGKRSPTANDGAALQTVLHSVAVFDPQIGYCQGMNFVANLLIEEIGEEPAFWLMVRLLRHHHLRGLYLDKIPILSLFLISFEEYLAVFLPDVRRHLHSCGFHAALYAVEWFTTLFANNLPTDAVRCVVSMILDGWDNVLFRVGAAVLALLQHEVLAMDQFKLLKNFKSMVLGLSGHAIIERAVAFPDGEDALQKIYDDPVGLERIRAFSLSGSVNSWDGNGADWGAGPPTSAASSIASLATWRGRASFTGASPTSRGSAASPRHRRTGSNTSVGGGGGAGGGAGVGARTPPMSPGSARRRAWDAVATATATNTNTTAKPSQGYETPTRDRRQVASRASPASPPPVSTHLPTRVHKPEKASEHTWRSLGRRTAHHRPLVPYKVNTAHVSVQYPVQCKDYMAYAVRVRAAGSTWEILRRYSQFYELHQQLRQQNSYLPLPTLPPKVWFGSTKPAFVAERARQLNMYLRTLIKCNGLEKSKMVRQFLEPQLDSTADEEFVAIVKAT